MDTHSFQERVLNTLENHGEQLTEIRVTLAEKYVTKTELASQRREAIIARRFAITSIIAVVGIGLGTAFGIL